MGSVLVGVDVGTTSAKAAVTTPEGDMIAVSREPLTWSRTAEGTEIDAQQLVDASMAALSGALRASGATDVIGLGIASMGEASVLLDSSGSPVAPVIAWHDTRDRQQLEELAEEIGEKEFSAETGLPFRTQWSLTKHRWQTKHDSRAASAVIRLGVAEWVVRALGGDEVCEQSLASRTGWLRLHDRAWWEEAVEWSGLAPSALPPLVEAGHTTGKVTWSESPSALIGATMTVAGHDHQAAAIGVNATQVGSVLDSCGTAEALVRTVDPHLDRHQVAKLAEAGITVGWHAEPGRWCLLGGTQGGLALQRVLTMLGLGDSDIAKLDSSPYAHSDLVIEGVDEDALVIRGVTDWTGPPEIWHEALRAVTQRSQRINAVMTEVAGPHTRFVVTGGWVGSSALVDEKQKVFGPLEVVQQPEAGARGAARMAAAAAGIEQTTGGGTPVGHEGGDRA